MAAPTHSPYLMYRAGAWQPVPLGRMGVRHVRAWHRIRTVVYREVILPDTIQLIWDAAGRRVKVEWFAVPGERVTTWVTIDASTAIDEAMEVVNLDARPGRYQAPRACLALNEG